MASWQDIANTVEIFPAGYESSITLFDSVKLNHITIMSRPTLSCPLRTTRSNIFEMTSTKAILSGLHWLPFL